MIYFLLLDRKERYPSHEDEDLPPRNEIGTTDMTSVTMNPSQLVPLQLLFFFLNVYPTTSITVTFPLKWWTALVRILSLRQADSWLNSKASFFRTCLSHGAETSKLVLNQVLKKLDLCKQMRFNSSTV